MRFRVRCSCGYEGPTPLQYYVIVHGANVEDAYELLLLSWRFQHPLWFHLARWRAELFGGTAFDAVAAHYQIKESLK